MFRYELLAEFGFSTDGRVTEGPPRRSLHSAPSAQTPADYALAFAVALAMGALRHLLPKWRAHAAAHLAPQVSDAPDGLSVGLLPMARGRRAGVRLGAATTDVLLYTAAVAVGFLNMLIVMTYNPGLFVAVVLGEVLGLIACKWYASSRPPGAVAARAPAAPSQSHIAVDLELGGSACH